MSGKNRDRKGPQLILPGGPEPDDEVPELDQQVVEMVSQQALQLVATNIAFAALAQEVARLSGDPAGFEHRLREACVKILGAMPMPADDPGLVEMFSATVSDNLSLIFEMFAQT
jgi:hypothetical protein